MKSTHEVEINIDEQAIQYAVNHYVTQQITQLQRWQEEQAIKAKIKKMIDTVITEYLAELSTTRADEIQFLVDAQIKQRVATKLAKMLKDKEKETP